MANKLLALVGVGQGPLLRTKGLERPRLCVSGLQASGKVHVATDQHEFSVESNGVHDLHETDWVQVRAEGGDCKNVVCIVKGA